MFALYSFITVGVLAYVGDKLIQYLLYWFDNEKLSKEDSEYLLNYGKKIYEGEENSALIKDKYELLQYRIKFEDDSEVTEEELDEEILNKIEEEHCEKVKYIIIEYFYNGKFMKYLTYNKDLTFPIYPFDIEQEKYPYYPEFIILNDIDITRYIRPWLGPYCNFYSDREDPIKLKDALMDHPDYNSLDFDSGTLFMISNKTPLNGRKVITKFLPCNLIWKRHAAVDPREEHLLGEK